MGIDFRVREFCAPARIWRLRRLFERAQWMAPEERQALQARLLADTVRRAYQTVPYWHDLFDREGLKPADVRTPADLAKLPILDRDAIATAGDRLRSRCYRSCTAVSTSGTTGPPLTLRHDRRANALEFAYYWHWWRWAGYRLGDRYAHICIEPFLRPTPSTAQPPFRWQRSLRRLLVNASALSPEGAPRFAEAFRRYRLTFVKGTFVGLYSLARSLAAAGVEEVAFRAAFSTAGHLPPAWRDLIERTLHCRVLDGYGHMERCTAISQCPEGGYHVQDAYGVLELVEVGRRAPFDRPVGRAVATSLHNRAMPLIRYDTGDLVAPAPADAACPCGRTLPLIAGIVGRSEDVVVTPEGRVASGLFVVHHHVPGIAFAQFVQDGPDHLIARICRDGTYDETSDETLHTFMRRLLGDGMRIDTEFVAFDDLERTPAGKIPEVISRIREEPDSPGRSCG